MKMLTLSSARTAALIAGISYLITFATSIPGLILKTPILSGELTVLAEQQALWGVVLEIGLAISCIATAVALWPVTKLISEARSLGFIVARIIEAALIMVGALAVLVLVTGLRSDEPADSGWVALHDWTFLIGPGLIPVINALLLGSMLFQSGLVPKVIPLIGLIGAPILLFSTTASYFGFFGQVSELAAVLALPIALWEFSIGVWMIGWGFRKSVLEKLMKQGDISESLAN